jgi:hypothetical protein
MKFSEKIDDGKKRKKIELTPAVRRKIQKHYNENKLKNAKYTQKQVSEFFKEELGYLLPSSTVSDIIKYKFKEEEDDDEDIKYRNRPALYPQLEDAIIIYYNEKYFANRCNLIINDETYNHI